MMICEYERAYKLNMENSAFEVYLTICWEIWHKCVQVFGGNS